MGSLGEILNARHNTFDDNGMLDHGWKNPLANVTARCIIPHNSYKGHSFGINTYWDVPCCAHYYFRHVIISICNGVPR